MTDFEERGRQGMREYVASFDAEKVAQLAQLASEWAVDWERLRQRITQAAVEYAEAMRPIWDRVKVFSQSFMDAVKEEYRASGAIYGDTDEGMMRWARERALAYRLEESQQDAQ